MPRIGWKWVLRLSFAIAIAVSIALSIGIPWAVLFVAVDVLYVGWRLKVPAGHGKRQREPKSYWSRTLR